MMEKISPPVRILLVAIVVAGLGAMLALRMLGPSPDDGVVAAPVVAKSSAAAVKPKASAKPKAGAQPKAAAKKTSSTSAPSKSETPAKSRAPKVAAPAASAPKPAAPEAAPSGFPPAVDKALERHEVVVVSLVVPGARVDQLAAAEAKAGAEAGGVGFLALNVLNEDVARALLAKLGRVHDPTLLVVKRPGTVALKIEGFADRDTVAQAAANASS